MKRNYTVKWRGGLLLLLGLFMFGFSGCTKEQYIEPASVEPQEIKFNAFIKEGDNVRPANATKALGGDLANGYMLSATISDKPYYGFTTAEIPSFWFTRRLMNADGTTADPTKLFWFTGNTTPKYHSFVAYSENPVGTEANYGVTAINADKDMGKVYVAFKQHPDPAKHIDLLVADKLDIQTSEGVPSAVNLYFVHRLSKVSVKVLGSGGVNLTDCQAKITYGARVRDSYPYMYIIKSGNGAYESYPSTATYFPAATYNLGGKFTVPGSAVAERYAVLAGEMILVPQTHTEGWGTVEISYTPDGSSSPVVVSVPMPSLKLEPMMQYVINLNILESTQALSVSSVELLDWTTTSGVIDQLL